MPEIITQVSDQEILDLKAAMQVHGSDCGDEEVSVDQCATALIKLVVRDIETEMNPPAKTASQTGRLT